MALVGDVDVHGQRGAVRERLDGGREAAVGEDRRVDAVRELAQLLDGGASVIQRFAEQAGEPGGASPRACASCSVMTAWISRCWAPSCRSRTTRRRCSSAAWTSRAREAASSSRVSAFSIA